MSKKNPSKVETTRHTILINARMSIFLILIAPLIGAVSGYFSSGMLPAEQAAIMTPLLSAIGYLVMAISVFLVSQRLAIEKQSIEISELAEKFSSERALFFDEHKKTVGVISKAMRRTQTFQEHGLARNIGELLTSRAAKAISVQNTFVDISDTLSNGPQGEVGRSYDAWLKNPHEKKWTDIVGVKEFFSGRYNRPVDYENTTGTNNVFVLRHSIPIINFIIFEYEGGNFEVFFGWLPGDSDERSEIFSTTDRMIVSMYQSYFNSLKRHSWNFHFNHDLDHGYVVDYSIPGTSRISNIDKRLADKVGKWITVSYTKKKGAKDGYAPNRLGLIEIGLEKSGFRVSSSIWNSSGVLEEGYTKHREIAHFLNNLFVGYALEARKGSGICYYKFLPRPETDLILGIYMDGRDEKRNSIIGVRLQEQCFNLENGAPRDKIIETMKKYDAKFREMSDFHTLVLGPELD